MAKTRWFNDNEYRDYPFVEDVEPALPTNVIVDCGVTLGPTIAFDHQNHSVYLAEITRAGDTFSFALRSTAPGLNGHRLLFATSLPTEAYVSLHATATWDDLSISLYDVSWSYCGDPFDWEGFLVLGPPSALVELLPTDGTLTFNAPLEPARIVSLYRAFVSACYAVNVDRTRCQSPEGCDPLVWHHAIGGTILSGCLEGPVRLVDGYNCRIDVDPAENSITINAVAPASNESIAGPPSEEVPLFPGEMPPEGRSRLDGALGCNEVFRTINGIPGPVITLVNGPGVTINQDPENHRVIVHAHMLDMAVCPGPETGPANEDGCPDFDPCVEDV